MTPRKRAGAPRTAPAIAEPVEPAGIAYNVLNTEHVRQLLTERLTQLEAEHYQHGMNIKISQGHLGGPANDSAEQQIAGAKAALVVIENAHAVVVAELKALE